MMQDSKLYRLRGEGSENGAEVVECPLKRRTPRLVFGEVHIKSNENARSKKSVGTGFQGLILTKKEPLQLGRGFWMRLRVFVSSFHRAQWCCLNMTYYELGGVRSWKS